MLAVTCYSVFLKTYHVSNLKGYELLMQSGENMKLFLIGNVVAFVISILAIKLFIGVIKIRFQTLGLLQNHRWNVIFNLFYLR